MPTIKLTLAYDGSKYAGWQTQESRRLQATGCKLKTVQQEVESALQKIFNERIKIEGSGRTDAGVHALAQTAHFKTDKIFDLVKLPNALNACLPWDIFCISAEEAKPDFHARFCAKKKVYRYVILNSPDRPLFVRNFAAWVRFPLKIAEMRKASQYLLGKHDFKSFQASDRILRKSETIIYNINIKRTHSNFSLPFLIGKEWITIDIEASGFLRNMVRNIVGTLIEVGRGRLKVAQVGAILKKKDRRFAGPCASACGLYLVSVKYGERK